MSLGELWTLTHGKTIRIQFNVPHRLSSTPSPRSAPSTQKPPRERMGAWWQMLWFTKRHTRGCSPAHYQPPGEVPCQPIKKNQTNEEQAAEEKYKAQQGQLLRPNGQWTIVFASSYSLVLQSPDCFRTRYGGLGVFAIFNHHEWWKNCLNNLFWRRMLSF